MMAEIGRNRLTLCKQMTMKAYNWGILGTGNIAHKFTRALMLLDNAHLHAVGSRDAKRLQLLPPSSGSGSPFRQL